MIRTHLWLLLVCSSACSLTRPNPEVCCLSQADCASIGVSDPQRPCATGLVCSDHICSPPQCEIASDCGGSTPHCAPDQTCVECVTSNQCSATEPVCDPSARACRGCTADSECSSGACNFDNGSCLAESLVVYASPTGAAAGNCDHGSPCSITRAFSIANAGRSTIALAPGTYEANLVVNDRSLAVHGDDATITAATGQTIAVNDRARVRLFGVTVVNTKPLGLPNGSAIDCESLDNANFPSVELTRVTADGGDYSIIGIQCTLTVSRSHIHDRSGQYSLLLGQETSTTVDRTLIEGGGGVLATSGVVRITNSVIANQDDASGGALSAGTLGQISVSFSTIYNSIIQCNTNTTAHCTAGGNGVCLDNSIVFDERAAAGDTISSGACSTSHSIVFPQTTALGASNLLSSPLLVDASHGDWHLRAGSPAIDAADPAATQMLDFDGTPRPQGKARDIGAFELKR